MASDQANPSSESAAQDPAAAASQTGRTGGAGEAAEPRDAERRTTGQASSEPPASGPSTGTASESDASAEAPDGDPLASQAAAAETADPAREAYEAFASAEHDGASRSGDEQDTAVIRTTSLAGDAETSPGESSEDADEPSDVASEAPRKDESPEAPGADAAAEHGAAPRPDASEPGSEEPGSKASAESESSAEDPFAVLGAATATSLLFHAPAPEDVAAARERAERKREEARLREVQAEERAEEAEYEDPEPGAGVTSRRRRRRRRGSEDMEVSGGDEGDPEQTVTRIRTARVIDGSAPTTVQSVKGSTRLEAKKQRRRESRQTGRRRQGITEAEFLARRESVERTMVVRQKNDRIQIGVLEDGILAEHFVSHTQQDSLIGSVYLGKVQNVLPSMEAAFVDIGRGRNAVLYAGEVNWDQADLGGAAKRIENALKPGDPVLVQATKDPVGHKGARLTSQVSLPGRYLVYVPGGSMTGISRKLPDVERQRLKKILKDHLPEGAGVIVRTAAEGASEEELTNDINRLRTQWEQIQEKAAQGRTLAPELLYAEPDLTIKTVRDVFNEDFTSMVVQGEQAWDSIEAYVTYVAPDLLDRVQRWDEDEDLFSHYRVDDQIFKALERKVMLPSGGSLVIDRTEAMTVIDVNTGKFTGSGGNLEETVTKNNLEAAEEIVRQLRLRDIGGIVVIDFIDMVLEANRDLVLRRLIECLGRDRTKHQVAEVTSLGLVQMTRKRMGTGLLEVFSENCDACDGRGVIVHDHPLKGRSGGAPDSRQGRNDRKRSRRLPGSQEASRARTEDPEQAKRAETTRNALAAIASATHHDAEAPAPASAGESEAPTQQDAASEEQRGSAQDVHEGREGAKRRRKRRGKRSRGRGQDAPAGEKQTRDEDGGPSQDADPAPEQQERSGDAGAPHDASSESSASESSARGDRPEDTVSGAGEQAGSAGPSRGGSDSDGGRGSRSGGRGRRGDRSSGRGGRGGVGTGSRSEEETRSLIEARIRAASGDDDAAQAAEDDGSAHGADSRAGDPDGRRRRRTRSARTEAAEAATGAAQGERAAAAQEQRRSRSAGTGQPGPSAAEAAASESERSDAAPVAAPAPEEQSPERRAEAQEPSSGPAASSAGQPGRTRRRPRRATSQGSGPVQVPEAPQPEPSQPASGAAGRQAQPAASTPAAETVQGTASVRRGDESEETAPVRQRARRSRRAAAPAGTPEVPASAPAPASSTPTVTAGTAAVVSAADGASRVTINGEVIELPKGQSTTEALGAEPSAGSELASLARSLGEREPGAAGPRRRPRRSRRAGAPESAPQTGAADAEQRRAGDAEQG
ncbi:Rne/Rng family ribonuclease [Kocuria palustris]|uniref:Rne/Rng family ribonuclease n=1 Tax=Kocuria palustris TaxID=71999 RepID=UPI0011A1FC7D|nr:Rne/Rng family ribonuclease [Kocuria palustris]